MIDVGFVVSSFVPLVLYWMSVPLPPPLDRAPRLNLLTVVLVPTTSGPFGASPLVSVSSLLLPS